MHGIREWLDALDLGRYGAVFEANDVDLDTLPTLTDADLRELGVSLGHRKKMLSALGRLIPPSAPSPPPGKVESLTSEGERRQVTVLFCDLVGSTRLSSHLDPEAYRALLARYHEAVVKAIQRFDGYVAQIQGDGILAYFGYPIAHEAAADRAIRASLDILSGLAATATSEPLAVRIGVASGPVVVSHVLAGDRSAVGETPNLAYRLQETGTPGEIIVNDRCRRLAGNAFDFDDRGQQSLKGIALPCHVWSVRGASRAEIRFDATSTGRTAPLVGREQELGLLSDCWARCERGQGQVVLVSGEPGIGKSRLVRALRERVTPSGAAVIQYQCSPYHQGSALHPIIEQIERSLPSGRADSPEDRLDVLDSRLRADFDFSREERHLMAALLSLPGEGRYGPLRLGPLRKKEETLRLLVEIVARVASRRLAFVLFEDVHWADPSTLEVMRAMVERCSSLPLLLVITFRPEFPLESLGAATAQAVALVRLSEPESRRLVIQAARGVDLPDHVAALIVERCDGVPLFLEELTRTVVESGRNLPAVAGMRGEVERPLPEIPDTLHDSLMSRLDRLIPVKEVAQCGAALGREFSHALMEAVAPETGAPLSEALSKLVDSGLVARRGNPPDATYVFKHALVRDAAYDSLLKSTREALHGRIARTIVERFPALATAQPELVAQHFTLAREWREAVPHWMAAGERALERVALEEAVVLLGNALESCAQLPADEDRDRIELDIHMLRSSALMSCRGWDAPELLATLEAARRLSVRLEETARRIPLLWQMALWHCLYCDFDSALAMVVELDAIAGEDADSTAFVVARWSESMARCWQGQFEAGHESATRLEERYDYDRHHHLVAVCNHEPKCGTFIWDAVSLWALGYPDQALARAEAHVALGRQVGHPFNLSYNLVSGSLIPVLRGDPDTAFRWTDEAHAISAQHGMRLMTDAIVPGWRAFALIATGRADEAVAALERNLGTRADIGYRLLGPVVNTARAEALLLQGRITEARRNAEVALDQARTTGHAMYKAETLRVLGNIAFAESGRSAAAEPFYLDSMAVAQRQKARGFELRTALSLARIWPAMGQRSRARDLLQQLLETFTEGLKTADPALARAVLAELRE